MNFFNKIKNALTKTSANFSKIGDIFTKKGITPESLEDFEELLLSADFGVATSTKIITEIKSRRFAKEDDINEFKNALIIDRSACELLPPLR